jgi:hypothetical protein
MKPAFKFLKHLPRGLKHHKKDHAVHASHPVHVEHEEGLRMKPLRFKKK